MARDSVIARLLWKYLISQRFTGLQHVLHALLRFGAAAEAQEGFPLQIEQVLFRYLLRAGQAASAEHMRQFLAHNDVVSGNIPALLRHPDPHFHEGETFFARYRDIGARRAWRIARNERQRELFGVVDESFG